MTRNGIAIDRKRYITMEAARALHIPIPDSMMWIDNGARCGFYELTESGDVNVAEYRGSFAPLVDYACAYMLEDRLQLSVAYKRVQGSLVIQVGCSNHGGAVMQSVQAGESPIMVRMFAVTQFAALHNIMEDAPAGMVVDLPGGERRVAERRHG